jgi:hypothetical protein
MRAPRKEANYEQTQVHRRKQRGARGDGLFRGEPFIGI